MMTAPAVRQCYVLSLLILRFEQFDGYAAASRTRNGRVGVALRSQLLCCCVQVMIQLWVFAKLAPDEVSPGVMRLSFCVILGLSPIWSSTNGNGAPIWTYQYLMPRRGCEDLRLVVRNSIIGHSFKLPRNSPVSPILITFISSQPRLAQRFNFTFVPLISGIKP